MMHDRTSPMRIRERPDESSVTCTTAYAVAERGNDVRVLHVVEAFGGGVFEQVRHLTDRLPTRGFTTAIAYGERPETPTHVRAKINAAVDLFPLPWTQRTLRSQVETRRALSRLYAEWCPDVIHLHSSFAGLMGAVTTRAQTPQIYTPHGYSFTMASHRPMARAAYRGVERFVSRRMTMIGAVSRSEADLATLVARPEKIVVINNGVPELDDPSTRRAEPLLSRRPSVVAMGRLTPQHRPTETAQILSSVADIADVEWIGDGRTPEDREPVERAGVRLTGWLAREQAVQRLRATDVYVHWAAWDGQPMAVLEAMAVGSVVVGSDIPALDDLIPKAQRCSSPEQAIAKIREILCDERMYFECLDSQEVIRTRYSANRMADDWAHVYRTLTGEMQQSSPHLRPLVPDALTN